MKGFTESVVEEAALEWLEGLHYEILGGPEIAAGERILRKYGYPPDKQEKATVTVLEQAEVLSLNWATM
jgi:hypothetical protein